MSCPVRRLLPYSLSIGCTLLAAHYWPQSCARDRPLTFGYQGGAPIESTLVPTRFLLLMAQSIVTIMTFYTKVCFAPLPAALVHPSPPSQEQNIYASMGNTYSDTEFNDYDEQ